MRYLALIAALLVSSLGLPAQNREEAQDALVSERHTNTFKWKPLGPGSDDATIAKATSLYLERAHYLQQPFNDEIAAKFFDKYLDALDPAHIVFLQSDVDKYSPYRTKLDEMTKMGDTSPAEFIFNRFITRFTEQVNYVTNLVATEQFDFTGHDRYTPNRKDLPRPKNATEAKELWRERVRFEWLSEILNKEKASEIKSILTRRYTRQLRMLQEFDSDDVLQIYLDTLAHIYDPHSDYMGKASFDNFNISMKLSLTGIGALLRSEDGYCKIQELMPGPAKNSGKIKPNDKIIAVAQGSNAPVDVVDMKLNKVVELIRGPTNTEVRLTIVPVDAPDPSTRKVVSLIRDEIKLEDQEAKAKLIELPGESAQTPLRLGIIDLPSFYADLENRKANRKSTTTDVAKLIKKLKEEKVTGIILDLRRNGGGSLEEAISLTGLFIKEGPVVQVQDPSGEKPTVDEDHDPSVLYDGPLVVLTSRFSASASEILAGALQDYGRALIVGDASTHGKGTVQTLLRLGPLLRMTNELGALKLTIRKFYRASGSSTQLKGVVPDIILPSLNNHMEVGEASLPNALKWDVIDSAKFEPVNIIPPLLPELRKRSETRVASDKDFAFVRDEIERFKKAKEEKSISMNEEERWREKKENEARAEARKNDLRSRLAPNYKTYDLTLKNVGLPGLPPPTNTFVKANSGQKVFHAGLDTPAHGESLSATNVKTVVTGKDTNSAPFVIWTNALGQSVTNTVTNTVAKARTKGDEDEAKDDSDVPNIDFTLEEGRRILQDLVTLTSKNNGLAGRP